MIKSDSSDLKSLSSVINDYLKGVKDSTERNLLKRFKDKHSGFKVKDVTNADFDAFLNTFPVSEVTKRCYASRLNRFQAHIGLSKRKKTRPKKSRDEKELERKIERKYVDKIGSLETEKEQLEKENREKDQIIDTLKSKGMEIDEIKNLEGKKDQLIKEIADLDGKKETAMNQLNHANLYTNEPCPLTDRHELLVDCLKCPKQLECSVIGKHWR